MDQTTIKLAIDWEIILFSLGFLLCLCFRAGRSERWDKITFALLGLGYGQAFVIASVLEIIHAIRH